MVTNCDRKSFGLHQKIPKVAQTTGSVDDAFDLCSGISWPISPRASTHPNLHEWWTQPAYVRCPVAQLDLTEIQRSSKIISWIWSIISGVVTVLGRPGWDTSQVKKSPRWNRATQFLMVAYDGACYPNVSIRMAWISFGALPYKGEGGGLDGSGLHVVEMVHVAWHASFQPLE